MLAVGVGVASPARNFCYFGLYTCSSLLAKRTATSLLSGLCPSHTLEGTQKHTGISFGRKRTYSQAKTINTRPILLESVEYLMQLIEQSTERPKQLPIVRWKYRNTDHRNQGRFCIVSI